jgi:hypothetical protein
MPGNGSPLTSQPYPRTVHDAHLLPYPDDAPGGMQAHSHLAIPSRRQQSGQRENPSIDTTPTRSISGIGKKRRLSDRESGIFDRNSGVSSNANTLLTLLSDCPCRRGLQPESEQILTIWEKKHPGQQLNPAELLALSVVIEAPEAATQYWLSDRRGRAKAVPTVEPISLPASSIPARRSALINTCTVKRRVPKSWNKAWDPEKPYSYLCRCGWTFTKKRGLD